MLGALARKLEAKGVYGAERRLKRALRNILITTVILVALALITGYYILLAMVLISAMLFLVGIFTSGRNYDLINREAILFAIHGFILANAGFDVTAIFDRLARMKEYEGSYVFRKIMGYFYFTGLDIKEAISKTLQEEKRLGMSFKTLLTGVYGGLVTGTDSQTIFNRIIQQEIIGSERDIEKFDSLVSSFLSGLMPVVIMFPLMTVLLGGLAGMGLAESLFLNLGLGIMIALILLFSENKFLYYPENIMLSLKTLFMQIIVSIAVAVGLYRVIGTQSLLFAILTFFLIGYYSEKRYIRVRRDIYSYLPTFLADLSGRISMGHTFTEAVTSMPLDIYGEFSRVLKYSIGNLINVGVIPERKDYDGIFAYRMYKNLLHDLMRGVYGSEALMNIRTVISLMSSIYDKVRSTMTIYGILLAASLSLGMLFVDFLSFLGAKMAGSIAQASEVPSSGLSGLMTLLSLLNIKGWIVDVYIVFAVAIIFAFGIFISSVTDGTRHGNQLSILFTVTAILLLLGVHKFVSPLILRF